MPRALYNENDPFCAAWLRNLIAEGLIADGDVDERSICDLQPEDLDGYTQVHLCAGIGIWSYALRRAGWPDDRPCWTASVPCQPFSAAGKRGGVNDERHLWPEVARLVRVHRPAAFYGEQVASPDGLAWIDSVSNQMQAAGYAGGAIDICSASCGAPNIRQRLYFVFTRLHDAPGTRLDASRPGDEGEARHEARLRGSERGRGFGRLEHVESDGRLEWWPEPSERRAAGGRGVDGLADDGSERPQVRPISDDRRRALRLQGAASSTDGLLGGVADRDDAQRRPDAARGHIADRADAGRPQGAGDVEGRGRSGRLGGTHGAREGEIRGISQGTAAERSRNVCRMVDADGGDACTEGLQRSRQHRLVAQDRGASDGDRRPGPVNGFWRDSDWLFCRDGRWRPVESESFPLAPSYPGRVGELRAYGNALNAEVATEFIASFLEAEAEGFDLGRASSIEDLIG